VQAELSFLIDWVENYRIVIWWIGALSTIIFLIILFAIPIFIVKLPSDFFIRQNLPKPLLASRKHTVIRLIYVIIKNVIGVMIIFAGIAMLFLPGQGVMTVIIGISLLNIRGKRRIVLAFVCRSFVIQSLNRLRTRFNKPTFSIPTCN
jgi:hypothetical protein